MKKSFLSKALAVALTVLMLVAASVLVVSATETSNVAKIGETEYATLQAAIDAAQAGDTVTLLKDIKIGVWKEGNTEAAITINKEITLDGNGFTLTSQKGRAINIDVVGDVEVKNLKIKQWAGRYRSNNAYETRCVNVIEQANLTLTNCIMEIVAHNETGRYNNSYVSGLNVATNGAASTILIKECTIRTTYGVVLWGEGVNVTIKDSSVEKALYGIRARVAASVTLEKSTIATDENMGTNNLALAIVIQADGESLKADANTVISAPAPKGEDGTATGGQSFVVYSTSKMENLGEIDLDDATIVKAYEKDPIVYLTQAKAQINRPDGTVMYDTLDEAIANLTEKDHLGALESLDDTVIDRDDVNAKLEELDKDFVYNEEGVAVPSAVVQIVGGDTYGTLAEAIKAATAGDTIKFLAHITENVTINKSINIDGDNFNYTGEMNVKMVNLTITKVNFINATVFKDKASKSGGTGGDYKFTYCNFTGENMMAYAIHLEHSGNVIIENCKMTGYAAFLQLPSSNNSLSVKNVEIDAIYYGFKIDYSGSGDAVTMENVTVTAGEYALYHSNYGEKTHVIRDCTFNGGIEGIKLWDREKDWVNSFRFEGDNTVSSMTNSERVAYVLAANATLKAPENVKVNSGVEGYEVVYNEGVHSLAEKKNYVAQIGDAKFETLAEAMAEANKAAGDYIITLLEDNAEVFAFAQNSGVNITIDGNGNTFTGKITLEAGAGNLTITNATLTPSNADAKTIVLNASTAPNITIDGCTMKNTGTKGAIVWGQASYTGTKVVIKNSTASNLQYLVGTSQTGAAEIVVENVTATNMAYLVRSMKATKVTVKDVTYSGLTFIQIRVTSQAHTLILENVDVKTNGYAPIMVGAPETGDNAPVVYSIQLKGTNTFVRDGEVITVEKWFDNPSSAERPYNIYLTSLGMTLAGPEGLTNIKTNVEGCNVEYKDGAYKVVSYVAQIGNNKYSSLADALAEANKAAGDYTITLLKNCAEEITFAQNAGVNITIDGNGNTFKGQIILSGEGSLTFSDMMITPTILHNAGTKSEILATIVLNAATAPNITIDGCTMKNTGTSGAIVWGQASNTNTKVVIKNSTASNLQYLVGTNQTGAETIVVDNVTATNMAYLVRSMKATSVVVKDVIYSGLTFVQIKNSNAGYLYIRNVTATTTQAGMPPITMLAPDSGNGAKFNIVILGENYMNGTQVTCDNEASWFASAKADLPYGVYDSIQAEMMNVRFGNEFSLLFAIKAVDVFDTTDYVTIEHKNVDKAVSLKINFSSDWKTETINGVEYYIVEYCGIAAKEMVDAVTASFHVAGKDGATVAATVREYALKALATSTDDSFKAAVVDMLYYGAAAQTYFNYKTETPAIEGVTDAQKELASQKTVIDDHTCAHGSDRHFEITENSFTDFEFVATSVRFENNISLIFKVKLDSLDGRTVKFSYKNQPVSDDAIEIYEVEDGVYIIELNVLEVADAHELVTCTISEANEDGETVATVTITDSVAAYVYRMTNGGSASGNAKALYTAYMYFANSFYTYLH